MILTFYLVLYQKGILNVQNQPYDEALEIPDGEEVASEYSPTPRVHPGNCKDFVSEGVLLTLCLSKLQSRKMCS